MLNKVTNFQNNHYVLYILSIDKSFISNLQKFKTINMIISYMSLFQQWSHRGKLLKNVLYVTITEIRRTVFILSDKYYQLFQVAWIHDQMENTKYAKDWIWKNGKIAAYLIVWRQIKSRDKYVNTWNLKGLY